MKTNRRSFMGVALTATLLAAPLPVMAQQAEIIYNSYLPPFDDTFKVGIRDFAARIEKESGGAIKVTVPDSSLAPSDRQYEMVRDGIADMAIVNMANVSQYVQLNQLGELPGMAPTAEAGSVALWETYEKFFAPQGEFKGVKVLSTHVLPGRQTLSVGKLAPGKVEDYQGAKIWATSRPLMAAAEAFGGVPMVTPFPDLQEFVSKGNLDALFIAPGSANGAKVLEYVTHITNIPGGLGSVAFAIFMSDEKWNELTKDQQDAVMRAADGLPRRLGEAQDASETEIKDVVAKIPTTQIEGEALAGMEAKLEPQIAAWKEKAKARGIANPDEVVEFYRSVLAREAAAN